MGISFNERIGLYIELQYYRPTLTKMQIMRAVEAKIDPTILATLNLPKDSMIRQSSSPHGNGMQSRSDIARNAKQSLLRAFA